MASRQRLPTYIPNSVAQLIGYMQYSFPGKFLTKVILQLLTRLFVEDPLRVLTAFFFFTRCSQIIYDEIKSDRYQSRSQTTLEGSLWEDNIM